MKRSRRTAQLIGAILVVCGLAVVTLAVTGVANDSLGGWLIRCGRRYLRHKCEEGEIPWGLVFKGALAMIAGMVIASGKLAVRRGGASFSARFGTPMPRPEDAAGNDTSASVPPPPPRALEAAPAADADTLARRIGL